MSAEVAPSSRATRDSYGSLSMIGLGMLLVLLTLYILTFFESGGLAQAQTPATASKAVVPGLTLLEPVNTAPAQQLSVEDQLRALIERANRAFIEARGTGNAAPLTSVATGEWLAQEQAYLAAMRGRGQYERWRLIKLEYIKIDPTTNPAFVCTRETWEYTIVNSDGSVAASRTIVLSDGYYVTPTQSGWFVSRLETGPG